MGTLGSELATFIERLPISFQMIVHFKWFSQRKSYALPLVTEMFLEKWEDEG